MNISGIITHLNNFVNTWKGWGSVFKGLNGIVGSAKPFQGVIATSITTGDNLSSLSSGLSSAAK